MRKRSTYGVGLLLIAFILVLVATQILPLNKVFYINTSKSEPLGLYVVNNSNIKKGDLVILKVPENAKEYIYGREWLKQGKPLLKEIYALPGDSYEITDNYIKVNNSLIGLISDTDSSGKPLPKIRGTFIVQKDFFLALATKEKESFDGRYFGETHQNLIITKVKPILTIPRSWEDFI